MTPKIAAGADRVDVGVAAERVAGGDLADQADDADRGGDRGRLRPTASAASSGARRIATSIRKVIRTIAPITSGSRDLVAAP